MQDVSADVVERISRDPFTRFLGIELIDLRPGYSRLSMEVTEHMLNFHGIGHGGAIFTLADAAFAAAGNSHGQPAVALTMSINYIAAAQQGKRLIAEAKEQKLGRSAAFYHIAVKTEEGELIASCQGVVHRKGQFQYGPKA